MVNEFSFGEVHWVSKVYSARSDASTSPFLRASMLYQSMFKSSASPSNVYTSWDVCYKVWSTQPSSVAPVALGLWGVPACRVGCSVDERPP